MIDIPAIVADPGRCIPFVYTLQFLTSFTAFVFQALDEVIPPVILYCFGIFGMMPDHFLHAQRLNADDVIIVCDCGGKLLKVIFSLVTDVFTCSGIGNPPFFIIAAFVLTAGKKLVFSLYLLFSSLIFS